MERSALTNQNPSSPGGPSLDPRYEGFFECFNHQRFFEAHQVLEALWLPERGGPDDSFYKGLIQLAGAFVHLQKGRHAPARALLKLAAINLASYPPTHKRLEVENVLGIIRDFLCQLESSSRARLLATGRCPRLCLLPAA